MLRKEEKENGKLDFRGECVLKNFGKDLKELEIESINTKDANSVHFGVFAYCSGSALELSEAWSKNRQ